MAVTYIMFICLLITLTHSTLTFTINTTIASKPKTFVAKLLHYDYVFHNPNATLEHRAQGMLNRSTARLVHLFEKDLKTLSTEAKLYSLKEYAKEAFYVSFMIGQPPVPQIAVMDTGSDFIWIKCFDEYFDFSNSLSFAFVPCSGEYFCSSCEDKRCTFKFRYLSSRKVEGILAKEKFTFGSSDSVINNVVFGCNTQNPILADKVNGVFGLSTQRSSYSLVKRLGSKFSYCCNNIFDPGNDHSKLIIGEGAQLRGPSTPLIDKNGAYYVILEGISSERTCLTIDPVVFNRTGWRRSGVTIDSGCELTWLVPSALEILVEHIDSYIKKQYGLTPYQHNSRVELYCYWGLLDVVKDFPPLTFHFADDTNVVLESKSIFFQFSRKVICLTFASNTYLKVDYNILGMYFQQNYNVGYDLVNKKVYFKSTSDCDFE